MESIFLNIQNEYLILYIVVCITSISTILSIFEWISLYSHYKRDGLFSWEIRRIGIRSIWYKNLTNLMFKYPNLLVLFFIQIITAVFIFFSCNNPILIGICCAIVAIISIILNFRAGEGICGADKMSRVILITGAMCFFKATPLVISGGLIFISLQLILAYSTAGWVRIFQPTWRNGNDLRLVLRQHTYSNRIVWSLIKNKPLLLRSTAMIIVLFECSFIVCPLLPTPFFYLYVIIGISFHVINAIIMGLNTFVWSFLSAYPALIWLHYLLGN